MKIKIFFTFCLATVLVAGCSKPDADGLAGKTTADEAPTPADEMTVKLNAETQKRIGLETASPAVAEWLPEVKGFGRVVDPMPLAAAAADLAAARAAAEASGQAYDRLKILAAQNNASAQSLETAQAAAAQARLAFDSMSAKFAADWGMALAGKEDLASFVQRVAGRRDSLVRLVLAAGERPGQVVSARLVVFGDETNSVPGEVLDGNLGVDPQTQGKMFLSLVKDRALPVGAAVTGFLKVAGEPVRGVTIPAGAVLRHEGKGWVYVQTGTTNFTRCEIPLDRAVDGGFFSADLSATNRIVVTGAQTVFSAEMSGGNFNSGSRD
jgi:hypothetical protein